MCEHLFCCMQSRPAWPSYKASLERNNYFQGNIEGSQRHSELLDQAVRAFLDSTTSEGTSVELAGARMLQLAQHPPDRAEIERVSWWVPLELRWWTCRRSTTLGRLSE